LFFSARLVVRISMARFAPAYIRFDPAAAAALDEPRLIEDSGPARRVGQIVSPMLGVLGLRLVRVKISAGRDCILQIMCERPDGTMDVDACEEASVSLSPLLDLEEPLSGPYRLEVSSPGIDRPLVRASDFARAIGHEAKIEMAVAVAGRKRFRGIVEGVDGPVAKLRLPPDAEGLEATIDLTIRDMAEARLVLTDDLIRQTLRREKAAKKEARKRAKSPEKGAEET
jgi:ribosome maturation factor RimP